ncbi:collagen alpha-1(XII) chain-like [Saccostrea cucullata]|uniref:collagen alpha-1(XII) chain-like n=1 Tax=Saccostrea cuccullata TaxID=36930 RepID=UPI002ED497E9
MDNYNVYINILSLILIWLGNTDSQLIFNLAESSSTDCSQDADIAFLIDTSRSLGLQAYQKELHFVERVLERYEIGPNKTKVAVITFSAGSKLEFDFNRYQTKDEVLRAIRSIPYTDGMCTTIYRALKQAREEVFVPKAGDRENVKNLAVILTDGETNPGRYDLFTFPMAKSLTRQEANDLKFHGVEVFGIGVGHRVDHVEMIGISSGARNYYRVDDIDDLEKSRLFHVLLNKVCASPLRRRRYMCTSLFTILLRALLYSFTLCCIALYWYTYAN